MTVQDLKPRVRSPEPRRRGNIVNLAREWLVTQNVMSWRAPFDTHSGRKSLAAWCQLLDVQYVASLQIHADLEDTWRKHYQPLLPPSGYRVRDQSPDHNVACAALLKFRRFLDRAAPIAPLPPGMSRDSRAIMLLATRMGLYDEAREIYMS